MIYNNIKNTKLNIKQNYYYEMKLNINKQKKLHNVFVN